MSFAVTNLRGQDVTLGTWLQEGAAGNSVTGTGDSFTAAQVAVTIADNGDNFGERNTDRQRVYQLFSSAIDFAAEGDEVHVSFDVTISGSINTLDTDFRMSLIDTSTNQGFYPISWDTGPRSGTYNRARFIDNLDGGADPFEPHGGLFTDAINGSGTVASTGAAPIENNEATALGLVDGNTLSFSVVMTREEGNCFFFTTNATEQNGDVIWGETVGDYDPVNPFNGDTEVRGEAINRFDGIVFGIFDDDPYSDYSGNPSYTVSNISITDGSSPLTGYAAWQAENFDLPSEAAIASPGDDPDRDGLANLIEYAVMSAPKTPGAGPGILTRLPGGALQLIYDVRDDDPLLVVTSETSFALEAFTGAIAPSISDPTPADGLQRLAFTGPPAGDGRTDRFLRVRFSLAD